MSKRVAIIGGGVIGLCTAYHCALKGLKVMVVESRAERRDGCSFGNAGMVVPSHFIPLAAPGAVNLALKWMWNPASPFYLKPRFDRDIIAWSYRFWRSANVAHVRRSAPLLRDLAFGSRALFEQLSSLTGNDFSLVKKGLLMLCQSPHTLEEEAKTAEHARTLGIPAQVLDIHAVAALDPEIKLKIAGAVYFPQDCHLSPSRLMASLQNQLEKMAVEIFWNSQVIDWNKENDRRLRSVRLAGRREIEADEFVLCGGSWSPEMARKLSLNIPIQAGKGYSLTLKQPRELPQICSILTEARVAVTPMDGALRVGGTMEITGLNETINALRVRGIVNAFCRYFPGFTPRDFDGVQPWVGLRPCSPDGLPFIGRTTRYANLSLATGHAMMGVTLGPMTGKLISEILTDQNPSLPVALLSPDRFN